ncbi:MAG: citrate:proton symporter [Bacteroidia bacterium]
MLAILGALTIVILLILIMTRSVSAVVALIIVPLVTALIAGFRGEIITFMTDGIKSISPTGVMFIFAIMFFGVLTDAGTFRPIIRRLIILAGKDPARVAVATAILAMIVHLDGSGAVTFLVTIPAMLPLFDALNMKRTTLATIVALSAGTMNILPWGGPTLRAASALEVEVTTLFNPILIPVMVGLLTVLWIAFLLGKRERKYLSGHSQADLQAEVLATTTSELERPRLLWLNIIFILISISLLLSGLIPPHIIFMVAFAVAITVNYPNVKLQGERINAHAPAALLMAGILFAAGCFTGILKGSGMTDAMAQATVAFIPGTMGRHLAFITGLFSMPLSLVFDPDSFYFGILPLLANVATQFGGEAIEVGRAAVMGQMTTGFPISPLTGSTYLLIGLAGVDMGDHQRKTIPYAFLITVVILLVSVFIGAISF